MHEDSRTNASDIIDYVISLTAIYNKIEKLSLNNDFSSDHSAILVNFLTNIHCVKSVRIWRFSGLYFPAFGLTTERFGASHRIHSKCWKIRTRKIRNMDTFHAVMNRSISSVMKVKLYRKANWDSINSLFSNQ